jgi:hypothetical protein
MIYLPPKPSDSNVLLALEHFQVPHGKWTRRSMYNPSQLIAEYNKERYI